MKIFLVGPMGSGKSKIGKLLSSQLNLNLIDIDREIEAKFEKTIVDIFASEGEQGFRKKEIDFLTEVNEIEDAVVSTGGGIIEASANRDILNKEEYVVFLNASVESQFQATKDKTKRPLLNNENPRQVLESLYEHRLELYKSVSNLELSPDLLSNEDIVKEIINFLNV
ncbi:MAG: shikimate kinase [Gammaproteobacteria bacterium]|jgi:shikimate kinase|nr:shikimate kinase [Gammaproteobacteria bacterium]|tara:strand:- start:355 stop:858 length:504 start_codon:yes stop_codon:yes gene_type:complete